MKPYPLLTCLLLCLALNGCGGGGGAPADPNADLPAPIYTREQAMRHGAWTVLVYMDADNDLEHYAINNFNQMEQVGSSADVRVIVQFDRTPYYDISNGNWSDTRRFLVTRDPDSINMKSLRLDDPMMGEANMGSPDTLRDFVQWGMSTFPADHYALVIWDHGTGWEVSTAAAQYPQKFIAFDMTNGSALDLPEVRAALADMRVDVLSFDACFMQEMEVAYELKDAAGYLVGSAAAIPAFGYDYNLILRGLRGTTSPEGMGRLMVDQFMARYPEGFKSITHSVVDLDRMENLATSLDEFARVLSANAAVKSDRLAAARESALNYSTISDLRDMRSRDFLQYCGLAAGAVGAPADTAYAAVQEAYRAAVVYEKHNSDTPTATGMSIYVPAASDYDYRYGSLGLAKDTVWDEWLKAQVK